MNHLIIVVLVLAAIVPQDAPPQFAWTSANTGRVTFVGPGVLEQRRPNGFIKRVYQADAAGVVTVGIPAAFPADLADRPQPGDVFCVGDLCSAPVQPRGTLYLPVVNP